MGQYVGRRSRGVALYHQPAAHETLGEYSRQYGDEIKHTRNPGFGTWRYVPQPISHFICAHIRSSPRKRLN
jgi:hypothetical protein